MAWTVGQGVAPFGATPDEIEALLDQERQEADRARRRGNVRAALRVLDEHLADAPSDARSRTLRALARRQTGDWEGALDDARRAQADATGPVSLRAECARNLAELLVELGRAREAVEVLRAHDSALEPAADARSAWVLGSALSAAGQRVAARETFRAGMEGESGSSWQRLLARARCARALGFLERASRSLVEADAAPGERGEPPGEEPDVLAELAAVYFEADAEIQHGEAAGRSPQRLLRRALELAPGHEAALLGQFDMQRVNWNLQRRSGAEILDELFAASPRSIGGLAAACLADLEDGQLVGARSRLEVLRALAPGRRDVRALDATLSWIEHRREDSTALLGALAAEDPADAAPEVVLGRTLNELYRFAEALPILRSAVERDPADSHAWTQLGRALANTGDSEQGLEALERAIELAGRRQDAWRHNTALVLRRMREGYTTQRAPGELSFTWSPRGAEVLAAYQVPFYQDARAELAQRYGFTPGPVQIQVFERFQDFSVRSTGFEGFPALGVCFGPVVTAVSPISEVRGQFSWARTCFHEFTHVIHLGLSHNRCPRWITEGLATWEEERRNRAWTRNMRRELVDALANRELIGVRELNRAFRGPRILFGYYQGGLLCRMLIERSGFAPIVRLLSAFDRGLDLDQALAEVYQATPEELDRDFEAFVEAEVSALAIEPRWSPTAIARLRLSLAAEAPLGAAERVAWAESWTSVAWGWWQAGRTVDSEQALRRIALAGTMPPRALFLQGEMALAQQDGDKARECFTRGLAAGGRDFRARVALGQMALEDEQLEAAAEHLRAAAELFPGYPERTLAAELRLAEVLGLLGREEEMQRAREQWLEWNSDEYSLRLELARWNAREGRPAVAERWFCEANQVDPFARGVHLVWGAVLEELGRMEEALREYRVALLVPPELDLDRSGAPDEREQARILALQGRVLLALSRAEEARAALTRALELDPSCEEAKRLRERAP